MKRTLWAVALTAVVCLSLQARADVKPSPLFSDGVVLQRGVKCPVFGTADAGETVSVSLSTGDAKPTAADEAKADKDGRFVAQLPELSAGGPYTLTISGKNTITVKDVYVGEVWLASGQSNMEMSLNSCAGGKEAAADSKNPKIHLFTVPHKIAADPTTDLSSKWVECGPDTVGGFSGVAYYFGRDLQKALNVPVGLIESNWGGTVAEAWTPRANLEGNPDLKGLVPAEIKIDNQKLNPNQGTVLFNGMINPLLPFAIKGVIWYQGESNAGRAYQYRTLFPTMIQAWREQWKNPDMPFLFVQLAPYGANPKEPGDSAWAELREAQLMTSEKVKNTDEAVITDVGDEKDIHPKRKEPVGGRLALAALAIAYNEKVVHDGPIYDSVKFDGNKAILSFKSVGKGLEAKDGPLTGFIVCGEDKKFHDAKAEIQGDTVVVTCDQVDKPVAVRYGWTNTPVVNLFNKDGLPASPFRTDSFPGVTAPKAN
ncbi:MAG TPA: sialate O-acetylesterase [Gemmataceae bacterium]|nr:sialate O-acetylesterase [Gemmataceae bacterium]